MKELFLKVGKNLLQKQKILEFLLEKLLEIQRVLLLLSQIVNSLKTTLFQQKIFMAHLMALTGIEDEPTFTRSMIVNVQEEIQSVVMAASYLDSSYVTRKILTLLGDGDQADEILKQMDADSSERITDTADSPEDIAE